MKGHAVGSWEICCHENLESTPANNTLNTLNFGLKKANAKVGSYYSKLSSHLPFLTLTQSTRSNESTEEHVLFISVTFCKN